MQSQEKKSHKVLNLMWTMTMLLTLSPQDFTVLSCEKTPRDTVEL